MYLKWSKEIVATNSFEASLEGVFYPLDGRLCFFYGHRNAVHKITFPDCTDELVFYRSEGARIPLPSVWGIFEESGIPYLIYDDQHGIDLMRNCSLYPLPKPLSERYLQWRGPEKKLVEQVFRFGAYTIAHKGAFGYVCSKNDQQIWSFTGRGYLHTEIVKHEAVIFFGTAGMGGYFYVIDLKSGTPILCLKTQGTSCIIHHEADCYVLQKGNPSKLLRIDLIRGRICAECALVGNPTDHSVMNVYKETVYVTTFMHKRGQLTHTYVNAVDISGTQPCEPLKFYTYHRSNGAKTIG